MLRASESLHPACGDMRTVQTGTATDSGLRLVQVAISTDDVYKTADGIKANGGKVTREAGPLQGQITTKIMATTDPDGYKVVFVDNADFLAELE